jgi:hypothetical protein
VQPFEVTGAMTGRDLTRALLAFPSVNRRRWVVFALCSLAAPVLYLIYRDTFGAVAAALLVVAVAAVTVGAPWTIPLRGRRLLAANDGTTVWRFEPSGMRISGPLGTTDIAWDQVAELAPAGVRTLQPQMIFVLPPLAPEEAQAVAAWHAAPGPGRPGPDPAATGPMHVVGTGAMPPGGRIVARGLPTPAQTLTYQRLLTSNVLNRRTVAFLAVGVGIVAEIVYVVSLPRPYTGEQVGFGVAMFLLAALLTFASFGLSPLTARALRPLTGTRLQRQVWGEDPLTWWFEADRLGVVGPTSAEITWSRVREVLVRDGLLVLRLAPSGIVATPLDAFAPGDAARVVALARAAGAQVNRSAEPATTAG